MSEADRPFKGPGEVPCGIDPPTVTSRRAEELPVEDAVDDHQVGGASSVPGRSGLRCHTVEGVGPRGGCEPTAAGALRILTTALSARPYPAASCAGRGCRWSARCPGQRLSPRDPRPRPAHGAKAIGAARERRMCGGELSWSPGRTDHGRRGGPCRDHTAPGADPGDRRMHRPLQGPAGRPRECPCGYLLRRSGRVP
jgi:hypothetical protein